MFRPPAHTIADAFDGSGSNHEAEIILEMDDSSRRDNPESLAPAESSPALPVVSAQQTQPEDGAGALKYDDSDEVPPIGSQSKRVSVHFTHPKDLQKSDVIRLEHSTTSDSVPIWSDGSSNSQPELSKFRSSRPSVWSAASSVEPLLQALKDEAKASKPGSTAEFIAHVTRYIELHADSFQPSSTKPTSGRLAPADSRASISRPGESDKFTRSGTFASHRAELTAPPAMRLPRFSIIGGGSLSNSAQRSTIGGLKSPFAAKHKKKSMQRSFASKSASTDNETSAKSSTPPTSASASKFNTAAHRLVNALKLKNPLSKPSETRDNAGGSVQDAGVETSEAADSVAAAASQKMALSRSTKNIVYETDEQQQQNDLIRKWFMVSRVQRDVLFVLSLYNLWAVPFRAALGSDSMPSWLVWLELALDIVGLCFTALNFFIPIEIHGFITLNWREITKTYLKGHFVGDLLTAFPLQAVMPFWIHTDFIRINRLLYILQFPNYFSSFADMYLEFLHPTILRILKFITSMILLVNIVNIPVLLVLRHDRGTSQKFLVTEVALPYHDSVLLFMKGWVIAVDALTGRNIPYPVTDTQTGVMLCVLCVGIVTSSVVIAGVTQMVISYIEQTSKLQNKVDAAILEMEYLRLPDEFIEEVVNHYKRMWAVSRNFDYETTEDLLVDVPTTLREKIEQVQNELTIRAVPLFEAMADNELFVNAFARALELRVFLPNAPIVVRGEPGDEMFFISKGDACVLSRDGEQVAVLGEGAFFGEVGLLFGGSRTATIVALTICQTYRLTQLAFDGLVSVFPEALEKIVSTQAVRTRLDKMKRGEALELSMSRSRATSQASHSMSATNNGSGGIPMLTSPEASQRLMPSVRDEPTSNVPLTGKDEEERIKEVFLGMYLASRQQRATRADPTTGQMHKRPSQHNASGKFGGFVFGEGSVTSGRAESPPLDSRETSFSSQASGQAIDIDPAILVTDAWEAHLASTMHVDDVCI